MWPGKKILLPRPYYYSYLPLILMAGMKPVFTELNGEVSYDAIRVVFAYLESRG